MATLATTQVNPSHSINKSAFNPGQEGCQCSGGPPARCVLDNDDYDGGEEEGEQMRQRPPRPPAGEDEEEREELQHLLRRLHRHRGGGESQKFKDCLI